jgi:lipopolysaccharide export system protein LptA
VQLTIGRVRKLLVGIGILLVAALAVFFTSAKWRNGLIRSDLPRRLGINIQQESNGVTYTQAHSGHILFKIHASRVIQLRNNHALLHNVSIEFYGPDGKHTDEIQGNQFEYDQATGLAIAAGPVSITLAHLAAQLAAPQSPSTAKAQNHRPPPAAQGAPSGEVHIQTSGLIFNQKTGVVTTSKLVNFSLTQGSGSAMGATYDAQQGYLVLDRAAELTTRRGAQPVVIHARHAEFERNARLCTLFAATADSSGSQVTAAEAKIVFRADGSAMRLDAAGGFTLASGNGGRLAAPAGTMDFTPHNQPRSAYLQGGVTMEDVSPGRTAHGTSPTAQLAFSPQGELRSAHLERGVVLHSEEQSRPAHSAPSAPLEVMSRTWRSPVADIEFRAAGHGQVEPASIRGFGGVTVTNLTRSGNAPPASSSLAADQVTGTFAANSVLTALTGVGHARMESVSTTGIRQTATANRLVAQFAAPAANRAPAAAAGLAQVQSAVLEGHVVLVQQPAPQSATSSDRFRSPEPKAGAQPQPPIRATAGRADYDGRSARLHLTLAPRVEDGNLQVSADAIDIAQNSGDAFAHGNVKATWAAASTGAGATGGGPAATDGTVLGGQGPAHAIAAEAQLDHATNETVFRGHVRLWQQDNSVSGPLVVLNRTNQTLVATSSDPAEPVRLVLVSADGALGLPSGARPEQGPGHASDAKDARKTAAPAVVRVRGANLWYSALEHKAIMRSGALGRVVAQTSTGSSTSDEVELLLTSPANHSRNGAGQTQVERLTAIGHVVLASQGRRATGERLVYTGQTGDYVLTGTSSAPPQMTDPQRGSVTGEALIFHSRDDSVSIEGGGHETTTNTTAPR